AKLKDNMMELEDKPIHMKVDDKDFMEAIWMNKRAGKYYVSYHRHYDKPIDPKQPDDPNRRKSRLDYGWSDSPLGPFTYQGILNNELGVKVAGGPKMPGKDYVPWRLYQSNHGGIVEYHGQEYLFYHTSALSSWRQESFKGPGTWTQRSVCIDPIHYEANGSIIPVQQTVTGVPKVSINQPFSIELIAGSTSGSKLAVKNKNIRVLDSGALMYKNINLGSGYYFFGMDVKKLDTRGKVEIRLDDEDGLLLGSISFDQNAKNINKGRLETFLRGANGQHDVYLVFKLEEPGNIKIANCEFFAGSPKTMEE
ncbi:MAG: carbohydrate-binding protein, partial [Bacteroidota bacterium]